MADLANQGRHPVLVSSGAGAAGIGRLGLPAKLRTIPEKQAVAAVGQGLLIHMYEKFFAEYGHIAAQVLLTRDDFNDRKRYLNSRNTLETLLRYGVIPVVNENDTVAVEEIVFGDNDTLSALVAGVLDADLLILLTDIDGLYTANPKVNPEAKLIATVEQVTPEIRKYAGQTSEELATGGMITKLLAAEISTRSGIPMIIAPGREKNVCRGCWTGKRSVHFFVPETRVWTAVNAGLPLARQPTAA